MSYPDVPAGELHTSALQLANFLIAHVNGGRFHGRTILAPASVAEMHTVPFPLIAPGQALAFYYSGHTLIGHNGGDWGITTAAFFRPADGAAAIVLVNSEAFGVCNNVLLRLFQEATAVQSRPLADVNCDGAVNRADIPAFVLALSDSAAYSARFDGDPGPLCDRMLADTNRDGVVNFDDINGFVDLLAGG